MTLTYLGGIMMKAADWKLGTSSWFVNNDYSYKTLTNLKENDVDSIEITHGMLWDPDLKTITKSITDAGLDAWSFHTPYGPFEENNLATFDKELLEKTIKLQTNYLNLMYDAGLKIMVIHPSGEPYEDKDRAELLKISADSLSRLADVAEKNGITLAVEDIPRTCIGRDIDEMAYLTQDERLRICFDTNHLLTDDNVEFIKKFGKKIITLHVSDYDFVDEKHWLPYEGQNDWVGIVTALEEVGYTGPWMYEIGSGNPKMLTRSRDLTAKDLYDNYTAMVNKVKAPIVK